MMLIAFSYLRTMLLGRRPMQRLFDLRELGTSGRSYLGSGLSKQAAKPAASAPPAKTASTTIT